MIIASRVISQSSQVAKDQQFTNSSSFSLHLCSIAKLLTRTTTNPWTRQRGLREDFYRTVFQNVSRTLRLEIMADLSLTVPLP